MELFKGNCPALVTPFTSDGKEINLGALKNLIDYVIENGVSAIVLLGTTGESSTLSMAEKETVVKYGILFVGGRVPVIVGAGSNCTQTAIENSKNYERLGASALLHVTPYYNKCTQQGLYQHYTKIADSVNIPIILYNVPARTGVNLLPETVKKLAQNPKIIGVKEASGNMVQMLEISSFCNDNFSLYCGDDALNLPALCIGAKGVISVVSNVLPKEVSRLCTDFFENKTIRAKNLALKLLPISQKLFCEVNPIPTKFALNAMGYEVGSPRLPLTPLSKENEETIKKELSKFVKLS